MKASPSAAIRGLVALSFRGYLLWFAIPLGTLAWLASFIWLSRGVSLGQFLGWIDHNLIVVLLRILAVTPCVGYERKWISARNMATVKHRIGFFDLN